MQVTKQSYTQVTDAIKISVLPDPIAEESNPQGNIYAFSYTVTIENLGSDTVQLMDRHWLVYSADEQIGEVVGPGVIGIQPTLKPGELFNYMSGTVINDPIGYMYGSYRFVRHDGSSFNVAIPRFDLLYPILLH